MKLGKSAQNTDEKLLVKRFMKGDMSAFEKLYCRHEKSLKFFAFKMTRSEFAAEEIVQEVFIKIWSQWKYIVIETSFKAYLYKMVSNRALNYLRDISRRGELYQVYHRSLIKPANETTRDMVAYAELEKLLNDFIERLPPQKKKVYLLYQKEGKSFNEIAQLLNISERTVQNHLYTSQNRIKRQFHLSDSARLLLLTLLFYI